MVLAQLSELRAAIERLGRRYEPEDSDVQIVRVNTMDDLNELERTLMDKGPRNLLVSTCFLGLLG